MQIQSVSARNIALLLYSKKHNAGLPQIKTAPCFIYFILKLTRIMCGIFGLVMRAAVGQDDLTIHGGVLGKRNCQ